MTEQTGIQQIGILDDRSPQSRKEESKLQGELDKINKYSYRLEGELEELETHRLKMLRLIALGEAQAVHHNNLEDSVRLIRDTRDNLEALKKERTKTEEAITALHPTEAQLQARRGLQQEFTQLAKKRLDKTRNVQKQLEQLRQILTERIDLTDKMKSIAERLECEVSGDILDSDRFEECLAALPYDLLTASERWQQTLSVS